MLTFALLLALILPHAQPDPPGFRRYGAKECGVSVASPHKLTHEKRTMQPYGITTHFFTGKNGTTTFRLLCSHDYSITGPSKELFATYLEGFVEHDLRRLAAARPVELEDVVGMEIQEEAPDDGTHSLVRVYIAPKTVFIVLISGSLQAVASNEASQFVDSLKIERAPWR
jgi:hypothetical protein